MESVQQRNGRIGIISVAWSAHFISTALAISATAGLEILRKCVRVGFWMGHESLWKGICCSTCMVLRRTVVRRKRRKRKEGWGDWDFIPFAHEGQEGLGRLCCEQYGCWSL